MNNSIIENIDIFEKHSEIILYIALHQYFSSINFQNDFEQKILLHFKKLNYNIK